MRHRLIFLVTLMIVLLNSAFAQRSPKRVVIIGLDGLSVEGFKTAKHPNLDKLIADGVLSLTTRPVMRSVTLPNWTSHMTGSGPECLVRQLLNSSQNLILRIKFPTTIMSKFRRIILFSDF